VSWIHAEYGMQLEPGSRIKTGPDAHASLVFYGGTTSTLGPDTDVVVSEIKDSQDGQPYGVVLKQQSGRTWNQVTKPAEDIDFRINAGPADIVVHGTLFSAEVDESGKATIETSEGMVSVSAEGSEVQVPAGQMTAVKPGEAPTPPAPMPPARNELVFTFDRQAGIVTAPGGPSTGYSSDGTPINQISGSQVLSADGDRQTVRIREPEAGEYLVSFQGDEAGPRQFSVEGYIDGKSAFIRTVSGNITAANEMLLKLHYDILDGLLHEATVVNLESRDAPILAATAPAAITSTDKPISSAPAESKTSTGKADSKSINLSQPEPVDRSWFRVDISNSLTRWIAIASIVALVGVMYVVICRNN
jgi:hypothetical protein